MSMFFRSLREFFTPVPLEAEAVARQTQLLRQLLQTLLLLGIPIFVGLVWLQGFTVTNQLLAVSLLALAGLRWRLRAHTFRWVINLFIGLIILSGFFGLILYQGFHDPSIALYFLVVILASQGLDTRSVALYGVLSLLAVLGVYAVEMSQASPTPGSLSFSLMEVAGFCSLLSLSTLVLVFGTRNLSLSYQWLQEQRNLLEQRVQERTAHLQAEITERQKAEAALQAANSLLEERVQERTAYLSAEIAERQQAETALRHSEERYRELINLIPQALMVFTRDSYILANPAALRLFGVATLEEFLQYDSEDFILPEQQPELSKRSRALDTREQLPSTHYRVRALDGRISEVELHSYPIEYQGQPAFISIGNDITARKQAEQAQRAREAAEAANHAKSIFLSRMSHELRTPLATIIGYSEILLENAEAHQDQRALSHLRKVLNATQHLLNLINDILDFSKIEAGRLELHYETFVLAPLLEEVVAAIEPLATKRQNCLSLTLPPANAQINADPVRVKQILLNLLSNAAKFTEQGHIQLMCAIEPTPAPPQVVFTITDTGIGLTPEQLSRLFQPFQQADASTTRKYGGTGLGLAITRELCQMHGGEITVQSVLNQGSTFTVRLPLTPATPQPPALA